MILLALTVFLSLAGLVDALYFTFAYYGRVRKARWVPEILCAREGSNCVTVVQTPYGRVFGVPNSLLGVIYYLLLIGWAAADRWAKLYFLGFHRVLIYIPPCAILIAAALVTVMLGFYLIYALIVKLHTHCPLCYFGHALNATLLVLLILLCK